MNGGAPTPAPAEQVGSLFGESGGGGGPAGHQASRTAHHHDGDASSGHDPQVSTPMSRNIDELARWREGEAGQLSVPPRPTDFARWGQERRGRRRTPRHSRRP